MWQGWPRPSSDANRAVPPKLRVAAPVNLKVGRY